MSYYPWELWQDFTGSSEFTGINTTGAGGFEAIALLGEPIKYHPGWQSCNRKIPMGKPIQGRAGLTIQVSIPFFIELTELAESLGVARHKLAIMALRAGLPPVVEQIRAEAATIAAQQSPAAPSIKGE